MMQRGHWAAVLLGVGCAPLTFSNESSVDYQTYRSVRVELGGPDGSRRERDYLEEQMRVYSGFRRVALDPAEFVDARLRVELSADSDHEDVLIDILFADDDEEEEPPSYSAYVSFRLEAADGSLIDVGAMSAEANDYFDATEAALDLVVLHYLRPYRL